MNPERQPKKQFYTGETVPVIPMEKSAQEQAAAQKQIENFKSGIKMGKWDTAKLQRFISFAEQTADENPGYRTQFEDLIVMASDKIIDQDPKEIESVMTYAADKINFLRGDKKPELLSKPDQESIKKLQQLLSRAEDKEQKMKFAA